MIITWVTGRGSLNLVDMSMVRVADQRGMEVEEAKAPTLQLGMEVGEAEAPTIPTQYTRIKYNLSPWTQRLGNNPTRDLQSLV